MRIGIEGQRLFRQKKHGMDFVALELVRNISELDHENEYFIFIKPGPDVCLQSTANVRIVELAAGAYPVWEQVALPRAAAKAGCDILHCTSNTGPVTGSIPMVLTVHDIFYLEVISLFKKGFSTYQKFGNMYRRYVVPAAMKKSKRIITVSESEKRRIAGFFNMYDERLKVVYNGVGKNFLPVTDTILLEKVKNQYRLPERYIFVLGNTDPKKNTKGVLQAYTRYHARCTAPLPLVVADFPENALTEILQDNNSSAIRSSVTRLDYIKNTDLPAIYSLAEFFLYPSFWESFGIPILEAMACGTPVITSNVFSMPEIAGDAALLIDPSKPEEIADAMLLLTRDESMRALMTGKGNVQAARFSWRNMAENVIGIYSEVFTSLKR
jgi:glycosyltransferase involved in cell wall biosynthesis